MLYTEGWKGIAPVEVCTEVQYPCKADGSISCQSLYMKILLWTIFLDISSFDGQDALVGSISYWETLILLFFRLGYSKLKREYMVKVFNGFINACFDC
jgi:hypothetical protein